MPFFPFNFFKKDNTSIQNMLKEMKEDMLSEIEDLVERSVDSALSDIDMEYTVDTDELYDVVKDAINNSEFVDMDELSETVKDTIENMDISTDVDTDAISEAVDNGLNDIDFEVDYGLIESTVDSAVSSACDDLETNITDLQSTIETIVVDFENVTDKDEIQKFFKEQIGIMKDSMFGYIKYQFEILKNKNN